MSTHIPGLYIGQSAERGRGVFTAEPVAPGDIIEICHVIVFPPEDLDKIHATHLHDYYFLWGDKMDHGAIALGYGSLYNHAQEPNAEYELDLEDEVITIICLKAIQPGEEVTIDYQPDPDYKGKLWFELK
jgi:SET domain-containing protein